MPLGRLGGELSSTVLTSKRRSASNALPRGEIGRRRARMPRRSYPDVAKPNVGGLGGGKR